MSDLLIFEHVPKTAGSSLKSVIARHFNSDKIYRLNNSDPEPSIKIFQTLPASEKMRFQLIMGHGAYRLRPDIQTSCNCVSFLRDPVDRIISHYYFVRENPVHSLHSELVSRDMDVVDYATIAFSGQMKDNYTRRFSLLPAAVVASNPAFALKKAIENLERDFVFIGLSEHFDLSLLMLCHALHWKGLPIYRRKNTTRYRIQPEQLDDGQLESLRQFTRLDRKLYDYVVDRFWKEVNLIPGLRVRQQFIFSPLTRLAGKVHSLIQK